jgi:hypothetical protein
MTTFCMGCKRVLCFDVDRSEALEKRLRGQHGDRLRREFPELANLARVDVPAFYCEAGEINGNPITVGRSCYHIAHPHLFSPHTQKKSYSSDIDVDVEMEDSKEDDSIMWIANALCGLPMRPIQPSGGPS